MAMDGDLTWADEYTAQYMQMLNNCAPATWAFLLTSASPINSIKRKKKECCLSHPQTKQKY